MDQKAEKNCTKIIGAHSRPHFSEDEQVFMVLKYTKTGNVLETIRSFQRQFPNQRTPCTQTKNGQLQLVCPVWLKFEQKRRQ